ncbi:MAG: hypothetical protein JEZ09_17795 [Salinivirgaceae bacterium]|nr:hypothetical protein [Salinivirgaceae bacterium]
MIINAVLEVDEKQLYVSDEECGHLPGTFGESLEREFGWLQGSGIRLVSFEKEDEED